MRLSLYEFATGAETLGGHRVVYDVANDAAHLRRRRRSTGTRSSGSSTTPRTKRRGRSLSRRIQLDPFADWVLRCDRIDFPPGGVAYTPHPSRARDPLPAPRRASTSTPRATRPRTGRAARGSSRARTRCSRRRRSTSRPRSSASCSCPPSGPGSARSATSTRPTRTGRSSRSPPCTSSTRFACTVRTGGRLLVDQLAVHGAELAFGVPGESYLAVLDALHDAPIRFVTCRHEVGRRQHGRRLRQAHRPARGSAWSRAGPGATHAAGGDPHRLPGLDAADPPDRPGRAAR